MNQQVPLSEVPTGAILLPPGIAVPTFQADWIAGVERQLDDYNSKASTGYAAQCSNWAINAARCQSLGVPLPPKPEPANTLVLNVSVEQEDGSVYVWQTTGDPVGAPCPDLPPLPVPPPAGTPDIGPYTGVPNYYACGSDDTVSVGSTVTVATGQTFKSGATVPAGKYQKIGGMMPGMNWYLKVG